jgi:hypothetical protein
MPACASDEADSKPDGNTFQAQVEKQYITITKNKNDRLDAQLSWRRFKLAQNNFSG